jgi:hypothetical protein
MLLNVVDGTDIRMIERRRGACLTLEPFQRLRICGHVLGKKFQGHETAELAVFGLIDHTHAAATEFFHDAVLANRLADQGWGVRHVPGILGLL